MRTCTCLALALTGALAAIPTIASAQIVQDGGFEVPSISAGAYVYNPTGGSWTFAGGSGLVNGTPTGFNTPSAAPQGNQVAFLQNGTASSISQSITIGSAGVYQLSFFAGGRNNTSYPGNTVFDAFIGNQLVGTTTTMTDDPYTLHTFNFTEAAPGNYALAFTFNATQPTGDNTAFLDVVQVSPVTTTPEPSSMALLGTGLVGLVPMVRRRRK